MAIGGVLIVLVVASDIFRSLLLPRASTRLLRVAPLLTMALFSGWQAAADRIRPHDLRQTVRASLAPLMLVITLAIWAALLILGFGMIFWVARAHFAPPFASLGEAVYAAGSAFSTLGINGRVAGALPRFAVLICSVAGLAIVTVVATFLISIQNGFGRREELVLRLESHVSMPPSGVGILERFASDGIVGRLSSFFDLWEGWAAHIAISHRAFPILVLFRSNDSRCEWLAAFGAVLDAAALLESAVADPPAEAAAAARFLLRTGSRTLTEMGRQFSLADPSQDWIDRGGFDARCARLAAIGFPLRTDADRAFADFAGRRRSYAPALTALADRLRIEIGDRHADPAAAPPSTA